MAIRRSRSENEEANNVVRLAAKGASFLILLQLISRLLTFILNQLLYRKIAPEILGVAYIQLVLLTSTIVFLAREGIRLSLLRIGNEGEKDKEKIIIFMVNMAWCAVPLGFMISCIAYCMLIHGHSGKSSGVDFGHSTIAIYCIASCIELCVEPAYAYAQYQLNYKLRVKSEAWALFIKCIATYVFVVYFKMQLLAFAFAQLAYAIVLGILYYSNYRQILSIFMPRRLNGLPNNMKNSTIQYVVIFTKQSIIKHILTEGDRFVMAFFTSYYDQGIYALVSNYGSMIGRFLFQPVEETARLIFARLNNGQKLTKESRHVSLLLTLLRFTGIIGLIFLCFGYNYTRTFIYVLLGPKWVNTMAPQILSIYCIYVLLMGINGVSESFVYAVADSNELSKLNRWLVIFAIIYTLAATVLVTFYSTVGLILANCINMGIRIIYSLLFIKKNVDMAFASLLFSIAPHRIVLMIFALSAIITAATRDSTSLLLHLIIGVVCFVFVLLSLVRYEKRFLMDIWYISSKNEKQQ